MNKTLFNLWKHRYKLLIYITIAIMLVMVVTYWVAIPIFMNTHMDTYTVTVTDKVHTGGRTLYLVFSEDENGTPFVFENRDTYLRGKVNSSDIQELIKVGETYTFRAIGYRWHYLNGWYPNIIEIIETEAIP